ncbi:MAG: helix-turn-helix domain-containing protein [Myxococcota bacterium]|nr:helix-turn-helix domain-containing protein [Myxococcota bacterium]
MKPFQEQTYYELLEVSTRASSDEIVQAFERANELYSADSVAMYALENPEMGNELRARIREAMEILTDEDLRGEYDRIIGVTPPALPTELLRRHQDRDDEGEYDGAPTQLAMTEVMNGAEAGNSSHREMRVAYVPQTSSNWDRPAPEPEPEPEPEQPLALAPLPPEEERAPRVPPPPAEPESRYPPDPRATPRARLHSAQVMASDSAIADAESALAQVAAKVKEAPPRPKAVEITEETEFSGELLRRVRESRGASLIQVADRTRIGSRHLENIEADKYASLPATVYLRGMLQQLAREIGLDPARVAKSYLSLAKR